MEEKPIVLIIEDELNIRDLIETVLSKNGFVTVGVDTAEGGLKKISSLKPSLIILDIQLPHMNGLEFCRKIRQDPHTRNIPIIVVSVQSSDINKIIGLESGADDFIAKPFNHNELLARVKAVLRRTRQAQAPS
jgi:DNA-binding response OmpR family regulator